MTAHKLQIVQDKLGETWAICDRCGEVFDAHQITPAPAAPPPRLGLAGGGANYHASGGGNGFCDCGGGAMTTFQNENTLRFKVCGFICGICFAIMFEKDELDKIRQALELIREKISQ